MNTLPHILPRTEKKIRFSAIAMMFVVAVSAVILSFDGLRTLAVENRISPNLAFLFPIIIDGTITMSSLAILRMNLEGLRATFGWCVMFFGVGLSIAGNAAAVRDAGLIAMLVHSLPPILLAISLELMLSLIRANIKAAARLAREELQHTPHDSAPNTPIRMVTEDSTPTVDVSSPSVEGAHPSALSSSDNDAKTVSTERSSGLDIFVADEPRVVNSEEALSDDDTEGEPQGAAIEQDSTIDNDEHAENSGSTSISVPQGKAAAQDAESSDPVENYRALLEGKSEWSRAKKIFVILVQYPNAKIVDIKHALGDSANVSYKEDLRIARNNIKRIRQNG